MYDAFNILYTNDSVCQIFLFLRSGEIGVGRVNGVVIKCPHCHQIENQVRSGKTRVGSQRYKCKDCQRIYTPEPKPSGYADEIRHQAVKLYVDGMNYRRIARHLGVDHKSVMHWVKAYGDQLPPASLPQEVVKAQMNELFTFIGWKKQCLRHDDGGS